MLKPAKRPLLVKLLIKEYSKQNLGPSDSENWSELLAIGRYWPKNAFGQCNPGD